EAGGGWHGGSLGTIAGESGRGLVRPQEGAARAVRDVHAAAPRGAWPRRGRACRQEQSDARDLGTLLGKKRGPAAWPVLLVFGDYSARTFVARGPRGLDSTSNETFSPPVRRSKSSDALRPSRWKK